MTVRETRSRWSGWAGPLSVGTFRTVWLTVFAASTGMFALVLVGGAEAYRLSGGSALWASSVFTALLVPSIVASPVAGALADRYSRTHIMAVGVLTSLVGAALVTATIATGVGGLGVLLGGCLVTGFGRAIIAPAWQALVPGLLGPQRLLSGGALMRVAVQGGEFIGPAVAAAVLAAVGVAASFATAVFFYVVALALLFALLRRGAHLPQLPASPPRRGIFSPIADGVRYVVRHRPLGLVLILLGLHCALTMAFLGLLPGLAGDHLHDGQLYGPLVTTVGLGAIVGALGLATLASRVDPTRLLIVSAAFSGVGLILLGLAPGPATALAGAFVAGAAQSVFMADAYTVTQTLATDVMRGRVASVSNILTGGSMSLVSLLWGALAEAFSPTLVLAVIGSTYVLATAAFLLFFPAFRHRAGLIGGPPTARAQELVKPAAA